MQEKKSPNFIDLYYEFKQNKDTKNSDLSWQISSDELKMLEDKMSEEGDEFLQDTQLELVNLLEAYQSEGQIVNTFDLRRDDRGYEDYRDINDIIADHKHRERIMTLTDEEKRVQRNLSLSGIIFKEIIDIDGFISFNQNLIKSMNYSTGSLRSLLLREEDENIDYIRIFEDKNIHDLSYDIVYKKIEKK